MKYSLTVYTNCFKIRVAAVRRITIYIKTVLNPIVIFGFATHAFTLFAQRKRQLPKTILMPQQLPRPLPLMPLQTFNGSKFTPINAYKASLR
jgi:hypothetical protein